MIYKDRRSLAKKRASPFSAEMEEGNVQDGVEYFNLPIPEDEIMQKAREYVEAIAIDMEREFNIVKLEVFGSRLNGRIREDSDLDIHITYSGVMKEDIVFNFLNSDPLIISGIVVDFFPAHE